MVNKGKRTVGKANKGINVEKIYLWLIHLDIWQSQYNIVKFKNKIKFKKKKKKNRKTPQKCKRPT